MSLNLNSNSVLDWLDYIQTLHAREIDLSLERVRQVYRVICPGSLPFKVVSVAGTNGKGSTAEIVSSIYRSAGYAVGKFTSPHLVRFNERFNLNGVDVSDEQLIKAFKAVESARGDVAITYFEYGLLIAVALFIEQDVDVAVMEVGLGGRLDAVNVLNADVAIITSIALDHTAWLGDTLDQIAVEKAGIARANTPCVVGVPEPQTSMLSYLTDLNAHVVRIGHDFNFNQSAVTSWDYSSESLVLPCLPLPFDQSGVQLSNAALAITAINLLANVLPVEEQHYRIGLELARLAGRCQLLPGQPASVLDVSHNPASLSRLSDFIGALRIRGKVVAVCGMLKDKEIATSLAEIAPLISEWHVCSIGVDRGASATHMRLCLEQVDIPEGIGPVNIYDNASKAFIAAKQTLTVDDCLVVFGSFYVVGDIISLLEGD